MQDIPAAINALRFTVSGTGELWAITPDEAAVLQSYQSIRDSGRGSLYIEFSEMKVSKYEVKHGGGAPLLNSLLPTNKNFRG